MELFAEIMDVGEIIRGNRVKKRFIMAYSMKNKIQSGQLKL